jgi:hypothetical protein
VEKTVAQYTQIQSKLQKGLPRYQEQEQKKPRAFRAFLEAIIRSGYVKTVFLTGANGFIATHIARYRLADDK